MEEFHKVRRLPPYVFEQVNRLKASARSAGADIIDLGMGNPDLPTPKAIVDKLVEVVRDPRTASLLLVARHSGTASRPGQLLRPPLRREARSGQAGGGDAGLQGRLRQHGAGDHRARRRDPLPEPDLSDPRLRLHHVGRRHPLAAGRTQRRLHPGARARHPPFDPEAAGADPQLSVEPDRAGREPRFLQGRGRLRRARTTSSSSPISPIPEIYFDGNPPPSVLQVPGAIDVTVEFTSMSKTFSMPGWRMGFAVGNERLISALTRVKSYLDMARSRRSRWRRHGALNGDGADIAEVREVYHKRRDVMVDSFGRAGWDIPPPAASMFAWAPIPEPFRHLGSLEFSKLLIEHADVAVAPGIGFGEHGDDYVRACLRRERAPHPPGGAQHQALPRLVGQAAEQRGVARHAALIQGFSASV